jgi:DNA-binding MarR family transcriptional regulator/GNAT superfamily N-acetyltransferase
MTDTTGKAGSMFVQSLGHLSFATRLKLLSDRLYEAVDAVYEQRGVGIESRWFVYLRLLYERGPLSTTQIASAIGTSHPAVSQLAPKLEALGLIARRRDPRDDRRTLLALTPEGKRKLSALEPLWAAMQESVATTMQRSGHDLLAAVAAFEAQLDQSSLSRDMLQRHARGAAREVRIEGFRPAWREDFYRLNAAWLKRDFAIEPVDHKVLAHPEREILDKGGRIFFALLGREVIGTCALERHGPGVYELIKMTVDDAHRGLGVGRALLTRGIAEFHRLRGRQLFLESNSKLKPALHLYESAGFVLQPGARPGSEYARADVYMIYRERSAERPGRSTGQRAKSRAARARKAARSARKFSRSRPIAARTRTLRRGRR